MYSYRQSYNKALCLPLVKYHCRINDISHENMRTHRQRIHPLGKRTEVLRDDERATIRYMSRRTCSQTDE